MSETNKKILELVKQNYSANEISSVLGITNKQLFYRLNLIKNKGFNIDRKYYSNGEIEYFIRNSVLDNYDYKNSIFIPETDNILKTIVISDLHLSSVFENIDMLDTIYNYCVKNNIHIIINAGDVNNCAGYLNNKKIYTTNNLKQIDHMLDVYPYDKNILNYILFGNHDYRMLVKDGIDISNILENKRHDLISLGYGIGKLRIKDDDIIVRHSLNREKSRFIINKIIIDGHHHNAKFAEDKSNRSFKINVPTLSDLTLENTTLKNQALEISFKFSYGLIYSIYIKQLYINDMIYTVNETHIDQISRTKNRYKDTNLNGEYQYKLKK